MAEYDMGQDFGDERTFANMLAETRFKPWLRKHTENGQEVVRKFTWDPDALNGRGNGSWPVASPADITDGEFFPTSNDFYKANGIDPVDHRYKCHHSPR